MGPPSTPRRAPYRLGLGLAIAAATSSGLNLAFPGELGGTDVTRGNLLGTSAVVVVAVVTALPLAWFLRHVGRS